jgi:hypothetical protein
MQSRPLNDIKEDQEITRRMMVISSPSRVHIDKRFEGTFWPIVIGE